MQHTGVFLLSLIVTLVYSQTSTNPDGAPFFSPSLVRQLPLDNVTISSVIIGSPDDYADFYWAYIPLNVSAVFVTLNATNSCDYDIHLSINFPNTNDSPSTSFPCLDSQYECFYDTDATMSSYYGAPDLRSFYAGIDSEYFRPGQPMYITVYPYNATNYKRNTSNCTYTIQAAIEANCSAGAVTGTGDGGLYCFNATQVTANGQTFSGLASYQESDTQVYRLDVPKNVTYVYAWVTSPATLLNFMVSGGFVPLYYSQADGFSIDCGDLASNTSIHTYYVDYIEPSGDLPLFFSIRADSSQDGAPYTIQIFWEYCGTTTSGVGEVLINSSTATTNVVEACPGPVQFTNMNLATQNYTFDVPAYNSTTSTYGAAYGYLEVPFGTYGAVNISCSSTADKTVIVYNRGKACDCTNGNFMGSLVCDSDTLAVLSQDLYSGGYWTFGACNSYDQPINVTLVVSGSVTVPASPFPVASASPGSSTGEDSSTGILTPAMMLMVLAALSLL